MLALFWEISKSVNVSHSSVVGSTPTTDTIWGIYMCKIPLAKNVLVDDDTSDCRKIYISDSNCMEIAFPENIEQCCGENGLFSCLESEGIHVLKNEARNISEYMKTAEYDSLSDRDKVLFLTSLQFGMLEGLGDEWSFPDGITADDFGEADYY